MLEALADSFPQLLEGLWVTIGLTILSLILGSILGILLAVGRSYGKSPLPHFILIYEKVFRGIPLLIILFILYFGLNQLGFPLDPFTAAILGLGLRGAAYQAQIYRSAINSIPEGQMTAGLSLGMSKLKSIRYIILPQVLRLSIPGWSNELTIILKDTSIAYGIGVIELMKKARNIYVNVGDPDFTLAILLIVALIYFILVISANKGLSYVEKKYKMSGFEVKIER
jgi:polar amino acid transport system permease protein